MRLTIIRWHRQYYVALDGEPRIGAFDDINDAEKALKEWQKEEVKSEQ